MHTLNENPIPVWERLPILRLLVPYCIGIIAFDAGIKIDTWLLNFLVASSWFLFLLLHLTNKKLTFIRYYLYPICFISYIFLALFICHFQYPNSKISVDKEIQYLGIIDESPRATSNYMTLKTSTIAYWNQQEWLPLNEHTH